MDKAGDILKAFLAHYRLEKGEKYVSLFSGWSSIVGEDLAGHTRVVDIRRGALIVEVDHPGWMQLLQMRQEDILRSVGRKYSDLGIRLLHMRLVRELSPPAAPAADSHGAAPEMPPEEGTVPAAPVRGIGDERLTEILERLGKRIREKNRAAGKPPPAS